MLPSLLYSRRARAAECKVQRFIVYHFPNGHHMPEHVPSTVGSGDAWSLPPMLQDMKDLKSELTFVSGLENQQRRRETGDHAIGLGAMLTARKPTKNKQFLSTSVDQVIADAQKDCGSRIPSLQFGTHNAGPTDSFGTYYTRGISWRGPSSVLADGTLSFPAGDATPLGKEIDLRAAFDRMFEGSDPQASEAEAKARRALRKSVLDSVLSQSASLRAQLNPDDLHKVDELYTGIRELEKEIDSSGALSASCAAPAAPVPASDFAKLLDQWHGLMVLALQCDITRVITFMESDAVTSRNLAFIPEVKAVGGDSGDHSVSHHSGQAALVTKFKAMVRWKQQQIASFLAKLRAATDGLGKSLLEDSLVMITSELADGNRHNHDDKPILLAGRLGGLVVPDRHVRFPGGKDYDVVKTYGDFFISLLDLYGVRVNTFGNDGKERITWER